MSEPKRNATLPDVTRGSSQIARAAPGFDFTGAMERLCADMIARLPELQHIELDRVLIASAQTRKAVSHGIYASLTPLRFVGGSLIQRRRGRLYRMQRVVNESGREMLYILTFYLPRFQETDLRQKLVTVLHELWHIGPAFDGDLRRHSGRCYAHTSSQKEYDRQMERLVDKWLAQQPPASLYRFLEWKFAELQQRHGSIFGRKVTRPKLIPIAAG